MATFEAKIYRLTIEPHPDADRIELARVGDYRSIVMKGQFKTGDLGVYIPESALVPEWMLKEMGLEGKLAGKQHNRVKAAKFRGVLSQGIVFPVRQFTNSKPFGENHEGYLDRFNSGADEDALFVSEGQDVTEFLGIEKYEPIIPSCMKGEVNNAHGRTLKFDIENIKKHPDIFDECEDVLITEKLHGTWTCLGYHPEYEEEFKSGVGFYLALVTSKGLSDDGLAFKLGEVNDKNLYVRALRATRDDHGADAVDRLRAELFDRRLVDVPCYILGETYGPGVQKKFHYGLLKPRFRAFDIYVGHPGQGGYMNAGEFLRMCEIINIETVPVLYMGAYSREVVEECTNGMEQASGKDSNIREGCVIKPFMEREDERIQAIRSTHPDRLILKSVSEAYLLQKGGTEFN